jgi:hypothetical protein
MMIQSSTSKDRGGLDLKLSLYIQQHLSLLGQISTVDKLIKLASCHMATFGDNESAKQA